MILNRHGLNYDDDHLSIGWADFALEDGDTAAPNSHVCPGKEMSKLIIQAFFEEYNYAGPWSPALPFLIYYNAYMVLPPYTLCKHETFGHCTTLRLLFALLLVFLCCCCPPLCCCMGCLGIQYACRRVRKGKEADPDDDDDDEDTDDLSPLVGDE